MTPEHESAIEARRRRSRSLGARTQQCEQHGAGHQNISGHLHGTMDVTTGGHDVQRQSDHQQAGRSDMCGLKAPVARPQSLAGGRSGGHGKKEQNEERQDPGVLVARGGELDVLDDLAVGAEQ